MSDAAAREAARIRDELERRRREVPAGRYSPTDLGHLFLRHGQELALVQALRRHRQLPLAEREILEVGCGAGNWLVILLGLGAELRRLHGIDLDAGRIAEARQRLPDADLRPGDATRLPWPDAHFDLVLQSTVFSSVLDPEVRLLVAGEMRRVLAPGGAVLWYDFFCNNPWNRNVRGIGRREIARLFPGWLVDRRRVTLAPPLARRIAARSRFLARLLESLRILDTHYFALLRPPP